MNSPNQPMKVEPGLFRALASLVLTSIFLAESDR